MEEIVTMEVEKNEMKGWTESLNNVKGIIIDFKIHPRKFYEAVFSGSKQNQELSIDIWYVLSKLYFQQSRIDDMDSDIRELLGKVDRIVEFVQKMVNMTQRIHCQETIANGMHPMEEISVSNPVLGMDAKNKQ